MRAFRWPVLLLAAAALATGCGRTVPIDDERVVQVRVPDLEAAEPVLEPLEAPPTPTPPPPTPEPTPVVVLDPPTGVSLTARPGVQQARLFEGYCWNHGDGRRSCRDSEPPPDPRLDVIRGETATLLIDAPAAPTELSIRPFQGSRDAYPSQALSAALQTPLELVLDPGEWDMDVCATWRGHGPAVCWLLALRVVGS